MPHPVSPNIMSYHVSASPVTLSNYQSHTRNPSHSHTHSHPDPAHDTIPSSPHTMSLHTQAHTPISPRAWPVGNILDDLEKWQIEEESELCAIDADRDEMEHAKHKEENSNKDKSTETTPRRISRLFRAISPRASISATCPSPSPSSSSPHLIPVKHSAIVPISAVAPTATTTPPLLLSPTASPPRSLSSSPQPSPRQSPQPSPQQSPATTPRAPVDGRPPTPRRSIHRPLKSPRMYLDEYHYLQHNPISPVMKILDRDYQIVDTAVTQVPIKMVKPIKKKEKKRHVPSSAPSSPCQTPTRPPSSSHSKTPPPPRTFSGRSSRGAISMLPSDVQPRSHLLPSPITLPRQTISEPSPIHAPVLPTFHPTDLPSTPKLPPIPEFTSRIAPPLPSLPPSTQAPPVPTWTRRESAVPSMPSIQESLPELKQVYTQRSEDEIISIISVEREKTKPKPQPQPLRKGESSLAATIAAINRAAKAS